MRPPSEVIQGPAFGWRVHWAGSFQVARLTFQALTEFLGFSPRGLLPLAGRCGAAPRGPRVPRTQEQELQGPDSELPRYRFGRIPSPKASPRACPDSRGRRNRLYPLVGGAPGQGAWPQGGGVSGDGVTVISSSVVHFLNSFLTSCHRVLRKATAISTAARQCPLEILILKQTGAVSPERVHTIREGGAAFCPEWPQSSSCVAAGDRPGCAGRHSRRAAGRGQSRASSMSLPDCVLGPLSTLSLLGKPPTSPQLTTKAASLKKKNYLF